MFEQKKITAQLHINDFIYYSKVVWLHICMYLNTINTKKQQTNVVSNDKTIKHSFLFQFVEIIQLICRIFIFYFLTRRLVMLLQYLRTGTVFTASLQIKQAFFRQVTE